jgi:hypothetical protein
MGNSVPGRALSIRPPDKGHNDLPVLCANGGLLYDFCQPYRSGARAVEVAYYVLLLARL